MLAAIGANLQDIFVTKTNVIEVNKDCKLLHWAHLIGSSDNVIDYEWVQKNATSLINIQNAISERLSKPWSFSS